MSLVCGCEIKGGMPVTKAMAQLHLKHTLEAMLFWQIMMRPGSDSLGETRLKLHKACADFTDAVEELYPEAKSD